MKWNNSVICKVVEPTEWVSPMVVAHKPGGDVRLCLDPLDLNKSVQRQHYPVPTAQGLFSRIGRAKYFSTLNATSGFLQVPLTEDSSYLTTFATPFGRYRFLRLPFGICSAPEVYQQMMSSCLAIWKVSKSILMISLSGAKRWSSTTVESTFSIAAGRST